MSFVSWMYPFFLLGVCALHWALPGRWRMGVLAAASAVFYGAWDARFLALMWMTAVCDQVCGMRSAAGDGGRPQKLWLFLPAAWLGVLALLPWELRVGPGLPLLALAGGGGWCGGWMPGWCGNRRRGGGGRRWGCPSR